MRVVAKLQNYYQDLATQQLMLSQSPDAEQWWMHSSTQAGKTLDQRTGNCVRMRQTKLVLRHVSTLMIVLLLPLFSYIQEQGDGTKTSYTLTFPLSRGPTSMSLRAPQILLRAQG